MTHWHGSAEATTRFPADPQIGHWLRAEGSLTARLRVHGPVEVRVQQQGFCRLWAPECADLHTPFGYVREVLLLLDGRVAVWARSATTPRAIQGPWRAMRGLGTRPLAELLFSERRVERAPLRTQHISPCGAQASHIQNQWQALEPEATQAAMPRWARSSVFWRHGHALRVMEAFSPWLCKLAVA
jgi:chorismate--pyruvate lyase